MIFTPYNESDEDTIDVSDYRGLRITLYLDHTASNGMELRELTYGLHAMA